jgi:ABC-type transporter lipoprotein component MlaA
MPYAPKPKPKAKKKPAIKVSQSTIDKIKARGMTKSLKKAQTSTNAEYQEAIRRMYGERRASAARGQGADARIQKPSLRQPKPKLKGGGGSMGMM